jgi:uncharacterized membrane protein YraQ (UPF0718 family)
MIGGYMKYVIWAMAAVALAVSFVFDRQKTFEALKLAGRRLAKITPLFFYVIGGTAIIMSVLPDSVIQNLLGQESGLGGVFLALGLGSVTMLPGFVAFPLAGALKAQGVTYAVLAAFTMTLMNVGVVTFPLEKAYLGTRVALMRNGIGLVLAVAVTVIIALFFGEVPL